MTTKPLKTIHIIAQAHLDPVWLWPWTGGLDEVLGTCRTACDLLDKHPDYIFTAGEAWRYQQIERTDPKLLMRIKNRVRSGRWEIVNGWWVQPDCNFPSGFALEKQIAVGKRFLLDHFGTFPEIGYNVDTFGHAATLPGYLRAAGQKYYIMMRPQENEMTLPARLFRWRGFPGTPEVTTFRIAYSYSTWGLTPSLDHIRYSTSNLPEGVDHTLCFVGIGDHGGGPTVEVLEWIRKNATVLEGWKMVFSSPSRFFKAIRGNIKSLPLVTGELQHHAISCYSVQRALKTRVRRAEHRLHQAEMSVGKRHLNASTEAKLEDAWQKVAFNHFHDILGGTCIPSAYPALYDPLGSATCAADEIIQYGLRRKMVALPDNQRQRMILFNASDSPFDSYVEHEPWTETRPWHKGWRLFDSHGQSIPCQLIEPEQQAFAGARLLFRTRLMPGEMKVVHIDRSRHNPSITPHVKATQNALSSDSGYGIQRAGQRGSIFGDGVRLPLPKLDMIEDRSDNWTHGTDRYAEGPITSPIWNAPCSLEGGPLMASLFQKGRIGSSPLSTEWRIYAGELFIELRLRIHWCERLKILKMTIPLPVPVKVRRDGIVGASLERPNTGAERPLQDWTLCQIGGTKKFGVVSPDVYALDATSTRIRLTLLRSPIMTHHDPFQVTSPRARVADQGEHEFSFRFFLGPDVTATQLHQQALMMHRPLVIGDLTKGMPRK